MKKYYQGKRLAQNKADMKKKNFDKYVLESVWHRMENFSICSESELFEEKNDKCLKMSENVGKCPIFPSPIFK